jgi:hypothetical protein
LDQEELIKFINKNVKISLNLPKNKVIKEERKVSSKTKDPQKKSEL